MSQPAHGSRLPRVCVAPPTPPFVTFFGESNLVQGDVQPRRSPHNDLQMVVVHLYAFEQLVDEHSALDLGGFTPDRFDVEIGKVGGDGLEAFGNVGSAFLLLRLRLVLGPQGCDLCRQALLFFAELFLVHSAGVVQPQ